MVAARGPRGGDGDESATEWRRTGDDRTAIFDIAARCEPPAAVELMERWWRTLPGAFRVARDRLGAVAGINIYCEMTEVSHRLVE